jgi:hypothetical protein
MTSDSRNLTKKLCQRPREASRCYGRVEVCRDDNQVVKRIGTDINATSDRFITCEQISRDAGIARIADLDGAGRLRQCRHAEKQADHGSCTARPT